MHPGRHWSGVRGTGDGSPGTAEKQKVENRNSTSRAWGIRITIRIKIKKLENGMIDGRAAFQYEYGVKSRKRNLFTP